MNRKGIPARAAIAGGVSRHYPTTAAEMRDAVGYGNARRVFDAIDEASAPLRQLMADRLEHVGDMWSPAQHGRRAA